MENAYDRHQKHIYCMYLYYCLDFFFKLKKTKRKNQGNLGRDMRERVSYDVDST
jgi:hypothetical protein